MTETITERKVKFVGRAKRYGKWENEVIDLPKTVKEGNEKQHCREYLKKKTDSNYAEIQSIKIYNHA